MAMDWRLCNSCELTYRNMQHFNSIMADSSDVIFQQVITFGCLSKLLTWAKAKQQSLKSSSGSLPTDLSAIVYAVTVYLKFTHMALAAAVLLHYSWNLNFPHFAIWTVQLIQHYQQVMQTVVWLHSVCMYQIHQNLKRQQSVNVPADKMQSYVSQNS